MQKLLDARGRAAISAKLHDNRLLAVYQRIWPEIQEQIVSVVVTPEDVFCQTAWLVDEVIDAGDDAEVKSLVSRLWSTTVTDIAHWATSVSLVDRYLIVSTMFRLVATAFSLHWHTHYCDCVRDAMLDVVEVKGNMVQHHESARQQEELTVAIVMQSDLLSDWANKYLDDAECWLTDEIDAALNPQPHGALKGRQTQELKRMKLSKEPITNSFYYHPISMPDYERNKRLTALYMSLNNQFILNTEQQVFINIFSGEPTSKQILWRRSIVELQYFISKLLTKKLITIPLPTRGKWEIVSARFQLVRHKTDETTNKLTTVIEALDASQFNKMPKQKKLSSHPILDRIISVLEPETDAMKISREITAHFASLGREDKGEDDDTD